MIDLSDVPIEALRAEILWREEPPTLMRGSDGHLWLVSDKHVIREDVARALFNNFDSRAITHAQLDRVLSGGMRLEGGSRLLPIRYGRLAKACGVEIAHGVAYFRRDGELVAVVTTCRAETEPSERFFEVPA